MGGCVRVADGAGHMGTRSYPEGGVKLVGYAQPPYQAVSQLHACQSLQLLIILDSQRRHTFPIRNNRLKISQSID